MHAQPAFGAHVPDQSGGPVYGRIRPASGTLIPPKMPPDSLAELEPAAPVSAPMILPTMEAMSPPFFLVGTQLRFSVSCLSGVHSQGPHFFCARAAAQ